MNARLNCLRINVIALCLVVISTGVATAQSCDSDSFFDLFDGDWSFGNTHKSDSIADRAEKFELTYGLNWLLPVIDQPEPIVPVGFKLGLFRAIDKVPRLSFGGSFSVHSYG